MSNPNTILILQTNFRFVEKATRKSNLTQNLFRGNTTNKPNNDAKETCVLFIPALERHSRRHTLEFEDSLVSNVSFLTVRATHLDPASKKEKEMKRSRGRGVE